MYMLDDLVREQNVALSERTNVLCMQFSKLPQIAIDWRVFEMVFETGANFGSSIFKDLN